MENLSMASSRTRILIATGLFPPQVGGPATYSKLLLEKLPEKGFEVQVESFGRVLNYPKLFRHLIYFFHLLSSGRKTDVIYAQDPVSVGLPALIAARLLGKKFYLKIVGDYAWEQGTQRARVKDLLDDFSTQYNKYPVSVRLLKKVQSYVASRADKILVPSNYLKRIVSNWGISQEKITVAYNAFHAPRLDGSKEGIRSSLGWQGSIIISAGRLVPWKGFDTLISLMPEVRREIPDAHLYIAGDGPDREYLQTRADKEAPHLVTILGEAEQPALFRMIKASDLFVLNTSYEGLSHQLLEVMALDTPIVTTQVGGNPETIESGVDGILVPYNDKEALKHAIEDLLKNRNKSKKLTSAARGKLNQFSEEKMLEELTRFLKA